MKYAESFHPFVDEHIKRMLLRWNPRLEVKDIERKHGDILDREYSIDGDIYVLAPYIEPDTEVKFTFQEKIRDPQYREYQDVTVEYHQNQYTKEHGDFFHLCVDYYIYCYINEKRDNLAEVYILKWRDCKEALLQGRLKHTFRRNKYDKSDFICLKISNLKEHQLLIYEWTEQ